MLGSIRNKTKGVVAYFIVGLITIPFALFGINEYFTGASNVVVATINDNDISKEEFLVEFNPEKRRLQRQLSEKYDANFDLKLKQFIINRMIDSQLLDQLADELGHVTTAAELKFTIQADDAFKENSKFSMEKYKQLLRLNGYNVAKYESTKLQDLTQNQIKYNLLDSAFVIPSQLDKLQKLNDQQRKFSHVVLNADNYIEEVKVDAKSIKDYYDNQKESFFAPEQVKVEFVELSLAEIAKKIEVSEDELFNFYEEGSESFTTEEERKAQHILIEDKAEAQKVVDLLAKGVEFNKLAQEYSVDTGSKDNGGDLGFFTRGVMVPGFEQEVFAMSAGQTSGLVKSEFGYHIIKLNEIKPGILRSFADVRSELSNTYKQTKAQKSLYDSTEQLANLAYESNLEEVVDQMDLKLNTTEFFARNNADYEKGFVNAAFSDVVLNKNENSEVLELAEHRYVVVRLKEKLAQRQKVFSEVKGEINTHLTTVLAKTFIDNIAQQIVKSLKSGDKDTAKELMDKNQLKFSDVIWVDRVSNDVDKDIVSMVFKLPKPSANSSTYSSQTLSKSSVVVIDLNSVKTDVSSKSKSSLKSSLLEFEANEIFSSILKNLRSNAEIKIFTQNL